MNTSAITGLAGTWQLLPDHCGYQVGRPPRRPTPKTLRTVS